VTREGREWSAMPDHVGLLHKILMDPAAADSLGVQVSAILWEKIEIGGAVLPHYHDVAEVIHVTKGGGRLLCNGEWVTYAEGDTFLIPKGVVHSVANAGTMPSEQVSIFLPVSSLGVANRPFHTTLLDVALPDSAFHG